MFTTLGSISLLFASATLLQPSSAFPTFTDSTVAYLTNCRTSDTLVFYSEVSIYSDVTQSFGGQGPDIYADTSLGGTTTWENNEVTWSYAGGDPNQADTFTEFINANAQDPAIPTFSLVGCAQYTQGFPGGALGHTWNCYKDNPRQLYATSDHECSTVYYCRIAPSGTCNLPGSGKSPQCRTYWMFADKLSRCEVGGAVEGSLRRWGVEVKTGFFSTTLAVICTYVDLLELNEIGSRYLARQINVVYSIQGSRPGAG